MYQTFVLGLCFLLVGGLAYYIKQTDSQGVLSASLSTDAQQEAFVDPESIPGTYSCIPESGCGAPRTLTLKGDGNASLVASFDNGVEVVDEKGTWSLENDDIKLFFTGTINEMYEAPHAVVIRLVREKRLSDIIFSSELYTDWTKPSFIRINEI